MRISVIGYSGSGKSSFAYKLGIRYQIEPTHIDKIYFIKNWQERDRQETETLLSQVVDQPNWIIDGNYRLLVPRRFELADQIFIFNFNRFKCLYGALKRRIMFHNKSRNSINSDSKEKFDLAFFKWIMYQSRTKKRREFYRELITLYPNKVIVFKTRRAVNRYLRSINIIDTQARP